MERSIACVAEDGVTLAATLSTPDGTGPWPCVVALHPASGGTRDDPSILHLVGTLVPAGIVVASYDRRGEGDSQGAIGGSLARLAADAAAVSRQIAASVGIERVAVWGLSQGGWIGPMAAVDEPTIERVVAVSACGVAPSVQMHFAMENVLREQGFDDDVVVAAHAVRRAIESRHEAGDVDGAREARVAVDGEPWVPFAYLPDLEDLEGEPFGMGLDPLATWSSLTVPTLAIYGGWDRWVPIETSIQVWRAAFADRPGLLTIERASDAGHTMRVVDDPADLDEAGPVSPVYTDLLLGWAATFRAG